MREERAGHLVGIIFLDEGFSPKNKWSMPRKRASLKIRLDLKMIKYPCLRDRRGEKNERKKQKNDQRDSRRTKLNQG